MDLVWVWSIWSMMSVLFPHPNAPCLMWMSVLFCHQSSYQGLHLTSVLGIPHQLSDWFVWPSAVGITWLLRHREGAPIVCSVVHWCPLAAARCTATGQVNLFKAFMINKNKWIIHNNQHQSSLKAQQTHNRWNWLKGKISSCRSIYLRYLLWARSRCFPVVCCEGKRRNLIWTCLFLLSCVSQEIFKH